jgi:hypothetical protein
MTATPAALKYEVPKGGFKSLGPSTDLMFPVAKAKAVYAETKFWVEKAGQFFSFIGTVGTMVNLIKKRKSKNA